VNWISAYSTICMRLPHGSRNSTPPPGKSSTPARWSCSQYLFLRVDDQAKMAITVGLRLLSLRERNELIPHIDKGAFFAATP